MTTPAEYIFFPVIVLLGAITTYEDIRSGKIKNRWIFSGICCAVLFYAAQASFEALPFGAIIANFVISVGVGYALWKSDCWSAGDAKLFSVYALLVPLAVYQKPFLTLFPSFHILSSTFIPAALFLFIFSCVAYFKKIKYDRSKIFIFLEKGLSQQIKNISGFATVFFLVQWIAGKISSQLAHFGLQGQVAFLILFFLYRFLSRFFKKQKTEWLIACLLITVFLSPEVLRVSPLTQVTNAAQSIFVPLLLLIFAGEYRNITRSYIENLENKNMPFAPWLFLGTLLVWFGFSIG